MDALTRRARLARSRLYFVTDAVSERLLDAALTGGVDIVQLRAKGLGDDDLVAAADTFRRACERHGALFVLNDRPDLVERAGADGVHVGQGDMPVDEARRVVGADRIVGLSTHTPAQMESTGAADYIGVGTIFATPTKPDNDVAGLQLVAEASRRARLPWFAIGGIDASNVAEVVAHGAAGVAVVRAIRDAGDPAAAARALRDALPPTEAVVTDGDALLPQIAWRRATAGRRTPYVCLAHAEVFHLFAGELEFRAGAGTVRLPAGSSLAAPAGLARSIRNPGGGAVDYLDLHAPGIPLDEHSLEEAAPHVQPIVSAPGDGDRLSKPHRLAVVKVDLPELALIENVVDREFEGPALHVHLRHADCFHVVEGALEFELESGRVMVEAGTSVVVPPGVPHGFASAADRVRYLNVHAPSLGFVDYLRALNRGETIPFDQHAVMRRAG